jgi:phage replication O-like protein O
VANPQPDQYTALSNELLEALIKQKLSGREFRVFMAIVRLTYGWKRKTHPIALSELSEITGIERSHAAHVIKVLIDRNMILRNGVTGIQKDYHGWVLPKMATDGVAENGSKSVAEFGSKSVAENGSTLISKEKKERKERNTPAQEFIKNFSEYYKQKTGHTYITKAHHFINISNLLKTCPEAECIKKAKILAAMCEKKVYPAKGGWSDFTIENLVRNWNSIVETNTTPTINKKYL